MSLAELKAIAEKSPKQKWESVSAECPECCELVSKARYNRKMRAK